MSINHVNFTGNLTRDPELRQTQAGTSVLAFGVAVNDARKNQQTGEWEEYPNFIDCTVFGGRAEGLAKILKKGMKISAEGKIHYSAWEKDGKKRSKIDFTLTEVELMSSKGASAEAQAPVYAEPAYTEPNLAPQDYAF